MWTPPLDENGNIKWTTLVDPIKQNVTHQSAMLDGILILAAGEGQRMAPFSEQVPKPFFCIDGKPLIQHTIDYAKTAFPNTPVIVSAQSKHLGWFEKIEGIDSIIINNTVSNYFPILQLKGRFAVFCADLLLTSQEVWSHFVEAWKQWNTAVLLCPVTKPKNCSRKGDQVNPVITFNDFKWEFVEEGECILSGISFINTLHSQVEGIHFGGFAEAWKMLHAIDQTSFIRISPGWHTFDTIREIADYEDRKPKRGLTREEYAAALKEQIQETAKMIARQIIH